MAMTTNLHNNRIVPQQGVSQGAERINPSPTGASAGSSFQQIMQGVQFSKHANLRLDARNIELSGEQIQRLENGVAKAQGKGIRDSLVLIDNIALLVNIPNRVVVTALNQQDQVFTNIDGAVIV